MTRTPQTRKKRNRHKSPSPSILLPEPSNSNTQAPLSDDQPIDDQANLTQTDYPSTSQLSTSVIRELTDQEELLRARRTAENASILRPFGSVNKRSTSEASAEDAESLSDNSEGEDAEGQIHLTTMQPMIPIPMTTMTPGTTTNLFTHMI
ncbi:hypothetical protein H4Q26_016258 [Puccinia striiformis f. sp. tritici PST-130]|nr:hypothetical protein H4Q26_016258 [Puccinia striiformis f. sp. tritici PST-130]